MELTAIFKHDYKLTRTSRARNFKRKAGLPGENDIVLI